MKFTPSAFLIIVLPLFCAAPCANAADHLSNITIVSDDTVYDVNADGTYTFDEVESVRINNANGIKERGQTFFRYSGSLQDVNVLEAYTTTKAGQRIDVPKDKIIVQQSAESAGAPMFDDGKVKTIVFPAVEVGAIVTFHIQKIQRKPLFPGNFSMIEVMPLTREHEESTVTVRAPAELKLFVAAFGLDGGQIEADKPGTQLWRWTIKNKPAYSNENLSVAIRDFSPRVIVSTFSSYEYAGAAYLERAKPKAAVTPVIQKLADDITVGIDDKRLQAEALYRWVSTNVRYVAIFLDFGGFVPHDATSIAEVKYGDCKDHTTLLEALLKAKRIRSSTVLVNADSSYWLPTVAAISGVFNHAITYLPDYDVYLDSTADNAMFGVLPMSERGKKALIVDDGTGKSRIARLPITDAKTDRVTVNSQLIVHSNGTVDGESQVANTGIYDWIARSVFTTVDGQEDQFANRFLIAQNQTGTGTYTHSAVRDLTKPLNYSGSFNLPSYVLLPGPGAMAVPRGLNSFSGIFALADSFGLEHRRTAMPFYNRSVVETTSLEVPKEMSITALPKPTKFQTPLGRYESSYSMKDRLITVKRELEINLPDPVLVDPADYATLRELSSNVMRDLRVQILYE